MRGMRLLGVTQRLQPSSADGFWARDIAGELGATPDDYVMAPQDVAKIVVLMCGLPPEVNLYEATILPNHMRSFIGQG
jgi:hypothetical protein